MSDLNPITLTPEEQARFWNVVAGIFPDQNGCWPWPGRRFKGYGHFDGSRPKSPIRGVYLRAPVYRANRVMLALLTDSALEGIHALHGCDNPPCVAPDHLYAGTHADNMHDRWDRGRYANMPSGDAHPARLHPERLARGSRVGTSRLTEDQVASIRLLYAAGGVSQYELADRFGVSQSVVWKIIQRLSWVHVS